MQEFDKLDDTTLTDAPHKVVMEKVKNKNYVFFAESGVVHYEMDKDCNLREFPQRLLFSNFAIGLQQNSAYKPLINEFSRRLVESGIYEFIRRKYRFNRNNQCKIDRYLDGVQSKLTLNHMMTIFEFLIIFCIGSFSIFIN